MKSVSPSSPDVNLLTFRPAAEHSVNVKVQALDFSRHDQAHAYEALSQQLQNLEVGVLGQSTPHSLL
jgi:hypothetical protein